MSRPANDTGDLPESYGGTLDRAHLAPLLARSNGRGAVRLTGHLGLCVITGALIYLAPGPWLAIPAMIAHGGVLILLFCGLHETIHRTAFRSRRLNDAVATVLGFLVFVPANHFRAFHMDHHRFTQDANKDPELLTAKPTTLAGYLWHVSGLPFAGTQGRGLVAHALGRVSDPFVAASERSRVVREARVHLVLYAGVAGSIVLGWPALLYYWLVPAVLGQPFLRLVLLAEHTGCALNADMHVNTRTTFTNALVRFVMWNMPYHIVHHVYPGIPFHALPAAHREMAPIRGVTANGYAQFHGGYLRALVGGRGLAFVKGG